MSIIPAHRKVARAIGSVVSPILSQIQPVELASTSSIIIFLSIVPLILVAETLSSEERESFHFSSYIRRVKQEVKRGQHSAS